MAMLVRAALIAIVAGAGPAAAGAAFQPPRGCTLDVTVQSHSCQVANLYRCSGDPAGDRWISYADGEGEYFRTHIDRETRWLESIDLNTGTVDLLDPASSADAASFSTLLATGRDDYDFVTLSNMGDVRRYVGHDRLTGRVQTIDKVPLEQTEFELKVLDAEGNLIATRTGTQFISREMRVFFGDRETFENAQGDSVSTFEAPVSFAFPGDKGFGAAKPDHDCDMMMTGVSPIPTQPTL
ncbi:hypothetical protein [Paenirhodobacter sp.]|uniref:hypothetical protein n=1 Tax=Paenirhodobacter sp. TaxID=1965326 RepID=UPI003B407B1A